MTSARSDRPTVRAAVLAKAGQRTRIEELHLARPRADEVRVRLTASGVCHSDLHVRDGHWERPTPIVLGHEGAGLVVETGTEVSDLVVGQPVVLSWMIPCGSCLACRSDRPWACASSPSSFHRRLDGSTVHSRADGTPVLSYSRIGTSAEETVVPAAAAIPIPSGVDPAAAALIGCCVSTGIGSVLRTAEVPAGASVAIFGLGGVGLACVMGAVLANAGQIIVVDRVASKIELARSVGATVGVLAADGSTSTIDEIRSISNGGPDFAFDATGVPAAIDMAIATVRPGGTTVLVGMPPQGIRGSFDVYPFVDGGRRILGSNYGSSDPTVDFATYARLNLAGRLPIERLVDRRVALDDIESSFDRLRDGQVARQVIVFDQD